MLKDKMNTYENVSIRKLSMALNINYQTLLKASKKPIVNEPYNPDAINYAAIEEIINKKELDLESLDWETMNQPGNSGRAATLSKNIADFQVGDLVYLRTNPTTPYEIIYKTGTHIVIMLKGTEEPLAWSYSTFFFKGPQFEPRTVTNKDDEVEA
jgi:hypothetical protein